MATVTVSASLATKRPFVEETIDEVVVCSWCRSMHKEQDSVQSDAVLERIPGGNHQQFCSWQCLYRLVCSSAKISPSMTQALVRRIEEHTRRKFFIDTASSTCNASPQEHETTVMIDDEMQM